MPLFDSIALRHAFQGNFKISHKVVLREAVPVPHRHVEDKVVCIPFEFADNRAVVSIAFSNERVQLKGLVKVWVERLHLHVGVLRCRGLGIWREMEHHVGIRESYGKKKRLWIHRLLVLDA